MALDEVIARAGGSAALALKLSALGKPITPQGVRWWKHKGIPAERTLHVAKITGLPPSQLRPDLYPPEPTKTGSP